MGFGFGCCCGARGGVVNPCIGLVVPTVIYFTVAGVTYTMPTDVMTISGLKTYEQNPGDLKLAYAGGASPLYGIPGCLTTTVMNMGINLGCSFVSHAFRLGCNWGGSQGSGGGASHGGFGCATGPYFLSGQTDSTGRRIINYGSSGNMTSVITSFSQSPFAATGTFDSSTINFTSPTGSISNPLGGAAWSLSG